MNPYSKPKNTLKTLWLGQLGQMHFLPGLRTAQDKGQPCCHTPRALEINAASNSETVVAQKRLWGVHCLLNCRD